MRLLNARSAYLRSAARHPVHWYEWSEEAFQKAEAEDKPVLLDIGAVWCHWCHVMDRESYENENIAKVINKYFIAIKVDRDERPDIDARYQKAVAAVSGQRGWPLTAFLTPQVEVFYGGTYFPPEDRGGFPGIVKVLNRVHDVYRDKKGDIYEDAKKISEAVLKAGQSSLDRRIENMSVPQDVLRRIETAYDTEYGGFGEAPKFPADTALRFLLEQGKRKDGEKYLQMAVSTLQAMYEGGIRDQLGGAFYRYSADRVWKNPHFEIMLYVNAGMLDAYSNAYRLTRNPLFKKAAMGIILYVFEELAHREEGGFSASQDADISLEDDGGYHTWSLADIRGKMDDETLEVTKRFYDIAEKGEMAEKADRNVLFMAESLQSISKDLKMSEKEAQALLEKGTEILRLERRQRKKPAVDTTLYTNWNALMCGAFFEVFKAFGLEECKNFALKTLDFLLEHAYEEKRGMAHTFAQSSAGNYGFFDDQIQMASALLEAYEMTGEKKHMIQAVQLTEFCLMNFWDKASGGFHDTIPQGKVRGLLALGHKTFEDTPTPASNAVAVTVLDRLYHMTGDEKYRDFSGKILNIFSISHLEVGTYIASFARAFQLHEEPPCKIIIVGEPKDPEYKFLLWAAHQAFRPGKMVLPLDFNGGHDMMLSGELKGYLKVKDSHKLPLAYVCAGHACAAPTQEISELKHLIQTFGLSDNRKANNF